MKKFNPDKIRLLHIQEAIVYVQRFLKNKTKQDLYDEPLIRFAVERQLEIIGEAANFLSSEFKENYSEIEWKRIVGFRNFLIHEYFGVDLELVWDIVDTKLPFLKNTIDLALSGIE